MTAPAVFAPFLSDKPLRARVLVTLAATVLFLDQLTKLAVATFLPLNVEKPLLPVFSLTRVQNTGAAFGIFTDSNRAFVILTVLILAVLAFLHKRLVADGRLTALGLAFLWGGALGNIADRLRFGAVTDFLDFHWALHHFPAFNVADSAINVGVGLMLLQNLHRARQ